MVDVKKGSRHEERKYSVASIILSSSLPVDSNDGNDVDMNASVV